ncbi:MAG: UbiA family prenyltransferase [Desulfuromonadales bacterium]|nr:UbiA family prenyltransferase [Desulfuromonadales bacterium]
MSISSIRVMPGFGQLVLMIRPGLTFMVAFSAVVGYLAVEGGRSSAVALTLWVGIALFSGGASILNQVQECDVDACMARTRLRPLVTGLITRREALILAVGCTVSGLALLFALDLLVALTALLALLLYNGLYTPLKRHTSFALFPGAISGALPVAAGWLAASGSLQSPRLYSLLIFMVLWQVPHFISLAICERDDYHKAGLGLVPASVTTTELIQLTRLWTVALAVGGLQLVASGLLVQPLCIAFAIIGTLWLMLCSLLSCRLFTPEEFASAHGRRLKLFLALFFLLILIDSVSI